VPHVASRTAVLALGWGLFIENMLMGVSCMSKTKSKEFCEISAVNVVFG